MVTVNDVVDEVQDLVWALVDERATDRQIRRLENLCRQNAEARRTYVKCMQLHADLHYLLGGRPAAAPPVVGRTERPALAVA
jgi:hypothetical protein